MSKRDLRTYLKGLKKSELEGQIIDLYERFKDVKTFYDFAFNPKEDNLIDGAKLKITKEYFPQTKRRPKARRSTAQNLIKHFLTLEMDPGLVADLMLFNIETAQAFAAEKSPTQLPFYVSIHQSYKQAIAHIRFHGLWESLEIRIVAIANKTKTQDWPNAERFEDTLTEASL
jgi:hypothetical protein